MNPLPRLLSLFLAILLFLAPLTSFAADQEASQAGGAVVIALRGKVSVMLPDGTSRPLKLKDRVGEKETIVTGPGGRIQVMFTDRTIVSLGPKTTFAISRYHWNPQEKTGALTSEVKEGTFRIMGGALAKESPKEFKTKTPAATIGIRGSMYAGNVTPERLTVVFQGGRGIEVANAFGTVAITRPGFGTTVQLGAPPAPPVRFTPELLEKIDKALTGKEEPPQEEATPEEPPPGEEEAAPPAEEGGEEQGPPVTEDEEAAPEGEGAGIAPGEEPPAGEEGAPPPQEGGPQPGTEEPAGEPAPLPPLEMTEPMQPETEPLPGVAPLPPLAVAPLPPPTLPPANELPAAPDYQTVTPQIPTSGFTIYTGGVSGVSTDTATGATSSITGDLLMIANWHSHAIFGAVFDPIQDLEKSGDNPVFFFGNITGTTVDNIKVFGFGEPGELFQIAAIEGTASGAFTGDTYDFFGLSGSGASYQIAPASQPAVDTWEVVGLAQEDPAAFSLTSTTGQEQRQGFVVAVSEDMNDPQTNRRILFNTDPADFTLTLDKDNGSVSGSISTDPDANGSGHQVSNLTVGGAGRSAYVADHIFAALLNCPSGDCIDDADGPGTAGLKPHGNYLIIEDPDNQFSSFFTWGYWEAAYTDPDDSTSRHIHVPYSMWLSGKPSTSSVIQTGFTGSYRGGVRATVIDSSGSASPQSGSFDMSVDFTTTPTITGTISLPAATLNISGGSYTADATSNSFSASLTGDGTTGALSGAFFGPNAEAAGGNFYSSGGGKQYLGIFGGDKY